MPKWVEKISKYNPEEKSVKAQFAVYLDLECLLKREQSLDSNNNNNNNNIKDSYTEKKAKHEPSGCAMFTRFSFDEKENKLNYYRGEHCIEKLCKKLKGIAMKIINYEEKEVIHLTKEEKKSYKKTRSMSYMRRKVLYG